MPPHLRIAQPVDDLARSTDLYRRGLDLRTLGSFKDPNGFDGVMLGIPGSDYHFEFTDCGTHPLAPPRLLECDHAVHPGSDRAGGAVHQQDTRWNQRGAVV